MSENRRKQTGRKTAPHSAWQPGQSGNPGGRPKIAVEVRDLAREHGAAAIKRLVVLMHSKNEPVAVRAAESLLDRGYGRPRQAMEDTEPNTPPEKPRRPDLSKLTNEELEALMRGREIMKRLIAEADAVGQSPGPSKAS